MSSWKKLSQERPTKSTWYLTKRTEFDSPKVTLFLNDHDGFGGSSRVTLWCKIPK